jgi:hypothetical protein
MKPQQTVSNRALTVMKWSLFVGIAFAVFGGLGFESSGPRVAARGNAPAVIIERAQAVFSPLFALVTFVFGAMAGSLIGLLWLRGRVSHAAAVFLVSCVGGLIGLACAAFFGSETTTTILGNSIETEHGAPALVMAVGALLGMIIGAFGAWWVTRLSRGTHPNPA